MIDRIKNATSLIFKSIFTFNPEKRNEYRFLLAAAIAHWLGRYRMYKYSHSWPADEEFIRIWKQFPEGSAKIKDKRFVQYQLARSIATLPGDTIECGVGNGGCSYLILKATEGQNRTHHIFDSFEGLSKPAQDDIPEDPKAHLWKAKELATPLDMVKKNLTGFKKVRYYKGWIPERFKEVADKYFAFVYIDVDLYQPTLDSLKFFYERTVPGGLIVCDDYGFVDCPGAKKAFDEVIKDKPERYVIHLTSGQGLIIKRGLRE